jgi:protein transport protein SEC61 subunit gamma-like protein
MKFNILEKLKNCRKILNIIKKPDKEELTFILKITGIGMIVIGVMSFIFYLISVLFLG